MTILSRANDNRGALPSTPLDMSFPRACPHLTPIDTPVNEPKLKGEVFSVMLMANYMDGGDRVIQAVKEIIATNGPNSYSDLNQIAAMRSWRCPSQRSNTNAQVMKAANASYSDFVVGMGYSYFARTDFWARYIKERGFGIKPQFDPKWANMISGRTAVAEAVLMNDTLFSWQPGQFFGPNHTKQMSFRDNRGNLKAMSGNNTLYGDGHVAWKPAAEFNISAMMSANPSLTPTVHPMNSSLSYDFF
jgi:prepilin-type processing-associated H-X9-DG protein